MRNAYTLCSLFLLVLTFPAVAQAGLAAYPADSPVPIVKAEPPKPLEYKVRRGDTVAAIAKKFSVDAKTLMAANGLKDARKLQAGKTWHIPGKTAAVSRTAPAAKPVATPAPVSLAKAAPAPGAKAPVPSTAAASSAGTTIEKIPAQSTEKADATARKAARRGIVIDPGVVADTPVKGKRGRRGRKGAPQPVVQAPEICIDAKTRSSFGKTGVIMNDTDVPMAIRQGFLDYANRWIAELETIGVGTFHAKKIKKLPTGQWEASYRVIIKESLGAEVKRVQYPKTPYVGHLTYLQRVFTSVGPTKQAALAGPYSSKDEAIREIFSYSGPKKAWR